MRRWWLLPLGIAIVVAGLLALLRGSGQLPVATGPPPLDDIDDASRQQLHRVLREADAAAERQARRRADAERKR